MGQWGLLPSLSHHLPPGRSSGLGVGLSSATPGWLPVLAVGLCEAPLAGRTLPGCEQPGIALFQQGSSCHLFGVEKHPGAGTTLRIRGVTPPGWPLQLCTSGSNHEIPALPRLATGLPTTTAPEHLASTRLGSWSFGHLPGGASARSARRALRGSISKARRHCQQVPFGAGKVSFFGSPSIVLHERLLAAQGCTRCPRGEVLQDTGPVLGEVSPGLVGALVFAWWQRMEAGGGPSHFSGTIRFTASTFLKTSVGTELQ